MATFSEAHSELGRLTVTENGDWIGDACLSFFPPGKGGDRAPDVAILIPGALIRGLAIQIAKTELREAVLKALDT